MSDLRYSTISFLSDYGHADEFVGLVHSVIRTIAPEVAVIDVTHEIPAHDVRAGGLALARSAQYLAPGVVVAVVDPGSAAGAAASPSRSATGPRSWSGRTTGCSPRRWRSSAGRPASSS